MKRMIINAKIITPMRIIADGSILFDGGVIEGVYEGAGPISGVRAEIYDAKGLYASPGFIDTHVHGGGGFDFMDATPGDVAGVCAAHMEHGTTTILPTSVACPPEELRAMLGACRQVMREARGGPNIPGIHLEGSYFNIVQAGAQNPDYIVNPDPKEYISLMDEYPEIIRWSAAPELPGGFELGRELKKRGILGSIAHSDAIWEEVREAYLNGYTHATHLYSGMSMTRRISAYRHGGVVEAAYLIDGMTVELIADGKHLPEELLKLAVKIKGYDKIMLVTDAMRMAGADIESYGPGGESYGPGSESYGPGSGLGGTPEGGSAGGVNGRSGGAVANNPRSGILGSKKNAVGCIIEDGVAKTLDRQSFAGSIATADRLVRTMATLAETPLREAVRMMTLTPAAIMGFKTKGAISEGMDADIALFDGCVNIKAVFVGGEPRVNRLI
jgi:N-acetylglucosamine-6-phosphate deacetylase